MRSILLRTAPGSTARPEEAFASHYRIGRPLAADDYRAGVHRLPRDQALSKRHIQVNPPGLLARITIDVDHDDAVLRAYRQDLPRPSWVAESPSGRAHAGYLLSIPVSLTKTDQKALRFAARIEEALRHELGGDPGYVGLLTKNPLHTDWEVRWGTTELHTLANMAEQLTGRLPSPDRYTTRTGPRADVAGLGRNCRLFEETRLWSYEAVRRYWEDGTEAFSAAVHDHASLLNAALTTPLPASEVRALANSISRWTWQKFTPEKFRDLQTWRSGRAAAKRTAHALEREQTVVSMRAEGAKWQTIADTLGISCAAAKQVGLRARKR